MSVFIEGSYEEIVDWLDVQQGSGVHHAESHGAEVVDEEGNFIDFMNFGLFSLVNDHGKNRDGDKTGCCYEAEDGYVYWIHHEPTFTEDVWMNNSYMDGTAEEMEWHRQYSNFH